MVQLSQFTIYMEINNCSTQTYSQSEIINKPKTLITTQCFNTLDSSSDRAVVQWFSKSLGIPYSLEFNCGSSGNYV